MSDFSISYDAAIVGGGVIGLLTALELTRFNFNVVVIDKGHLGSESSSAGGGILSPLKPWKTNITTNQSARYSCELYSMLLPNIQSEVGIEVEYQQQGMAICDVDKDVMEYCQQCGLSTQYLKNLTDLYHDQDLTHHFSDSILLLPEVASLNPKELMTGLIALCKKRGVCYIKHTKVNEFIINNDQCQSILTESSEKISAANYVVCTGAWSNHLLSQIGIDIGIHPVRGQIIQLASKPKWLTSILQQDDIYFIPKLDNTLLIGSTVERVGFDASISKEASDYLLQKAIALIPELTHVKVIDHWAGLRPGSIGGVPIIDRHPNINNLFINTGHYRCGITLAPASADLMTKMITGSNVLPGFAQDFSIQSLQKRMMKKVA